MLNAGGKAVPGPWRAEEERQSQGPWRAEEEWQSPAREREAGDTGLEALASRSGCCSGLTYLPSSTSTRPHRPCVMRHFRN